MSDKKIKNKEPQTKKKPLRNGKKKVVKEEDAGKIIDECYAAAINSYTQKVENLMRKIAVTNGEIKEKKNSGKGYPKETLYTTCKCGHEIKVMNSDTSRLEILRFKNNYVSCELDFINNRFYSELEPPFPAESLAEYSFPYKCPKCKQSGTVINHKQFVFQEMIGKRFCYLGEYGGTKYISFPMSIKHIFKPVLSEQRITGCKFDHLSNPHNKPREVLVFFENGAAVRLTGGESLAKVKYSSKDILDFMSSGSFLNIGLDGKIDYYFGDIPKESVIKHIGNDGFLFMKSYFDNRDKKGVTLDLDTVQEPFYFNTALEATKHFNKIGITDGSKIFELLKNPNVVKLRDFRNDDFIDSVNIQSQSLVHLEYPGSFEEVSYSDILVRVIKKDENGKEYEIRGFGRGSGGHEVKTWGGKISVQSLQNLGYFSRLTLDEIQEIMKSQETIASFFEFCMLAIGPMEQIFSALDKETAFAFLKSLTKRFQRGNYNHFNVYSSIVKNKFGTTPSEICGFSAANLRIVIDRLLKIEDDPLFFNMMFFWFETNTRLKEKLTEENLDFLIDFEELLRGNGWPEKVLGILDNIFVIQKYCSIEKIAKYLTDCQDRQRIDVKAAASLWADMLTFSNMAGLPINKKTKYPFSLKLAHDQAAYAAKIFEDKKMQEKFAEEIISEKYKSYEFSNDEFLIRAPINKNDLIDEGEQLSHCVGAYVEKIANKKSKIFFMRRKEDPEKSLFTLEIIGNRITQVGGFDNEQVTSGSPEEDFLKAFAKTKKLELK